MQLARHEHDEPSNQKRTWESGISNAWQSWWVFFFGIHNPTRAPLCPSPLRLRCRRTAKREFMVEDHFVDLWWVRCLSSTFTTHVVNEWPPKMISRGITKRRGYITPGWLHTLCLQGLNFIDLLLVHTYLFRFWRQSHQPTDTQRIFQFRFSSLFAEI